MVKDVIRFGRQAPEVLRPENEAEVRCGCRAAGCFGCFPPRVFLPSGVFPCSCLLPPLLHEMSLLLRLLVAQPRQPPPAATARPCTVCQDEPGRVPDPARLRPGLPRLLCGAHVRRRVVRAQRAGAGPRAGVQGGAGPAAAGCGRERQACGQGRARLQPQDTIPLLPASPRRSLPHPIIIIIIVIVLSFSPLPTHHPHPPHPPTLPPTPQVLDFPVRTLIAFWVNHHLLDLTQRPCWRVVSGRSKTYVDRITSGEALARCSLRPGGWLCCLGCRGGRPLLHLFPPVARVYPCQPHPTLPYTTPRRAARRAHEHAGQRSAQPGPAGPGGAHRCGWRGAVRRGTAGHALGRQPQNPGAAGAQGGWLGLLVGCRPYAHA